jgi:uncharacterized protein
MALPRKLKHFNVFLDGKSWLGLCPELTLPKLQRKMEDYRGGGMEGPVKIDQGQDALELDFTTGFDGAIFKKYGAAKVDAVLLRFAGSYQRDDTAEVIAVEVVVRGRIAEIDQGNAKAGDDAPVKVKLACSYYKLTTNNQVLIEIDLVNFIHQVDGEDMLAAHRAALGI